jgi:peptidyl-prolyl cis-trans isomerase SurA
MKRILTTVLLVGVAALPLRADILEQILVKVNGDIITKTQLEAQQVRALRQRNLPYDEKDLQGDDATLKKALVEVTPEILVNSIDEMLLLQRGRELGYKLSDEQFKQILENIRKENKIETDAQFQQALDQEGLTMEQFRHQIEQQLIISRVQQVEVMPKLSISEEEAKRYYDTHKTEFMGESTVTLREILINVPTLKPGEMNVAAEEEAKAKAEAIRARVMRGEDFAKVAGEVSDAPSKANGGLIGPIKTADIDPNVLKILDELKVGDITQPIRTPRGFQILKLEAETKGDLQPFDKARDLIADKVYAEKQRTEMAKYIEKLRDQAIIEWKNEDLKKMYDDYLASHKIAPEDLPSHRG